jgi:hypothetical protein
MINPPVLLFNAEFAGCHGLDRFRIRAALSLRIRERVQEYLLGGLQQPLFLFFRKRSFAQGETFQYPVVFAYASRDKAEAAAQTGFVLFLFRGSNCFAELVHTVTKPLHGRPGLQSGDSPNVTPGFVHECPAK